MVAIGCCSRQCVGLDGVLRNFYPMNTRRNYHAVLCCLALLARASTVQANPVTNQVISLTSPWRYTTNNVDAANWLSVDYNDAAWSGPSNGLFYMESSALPAAKSTPLPPQADGSPLSCYYFRTRFTVTNISQVVALDVAHLVDDGAVFYLNGAEIQRVRMGAGSVVNATQAYATPTDGDATSIESFAVVGGLRASLLVQNASAAGAAEAPAPVGHGRRRNGQRERAGRAGRVRVGERHQHCTRLAAARR